MGDSLQQTPSAGTGLAGEAKQFDLIIIGAGVTGLYQLYRARQLDGGDRQVAGVEPQGTGRLDHALDVQRGRTVKGAPVEPHVPSEVEVPDDHLTRVGERMPVLPVALSRVGLE